MNKGEKGQTAAKLSRLPTVQDVNAEFTLTEEQKTAIQECVRKGSLRVTLKSDQISIIGGDVLGEAYLWD
jgi:hypothetical protein